MKNLRVFSALTLSFALNACGGGAGGVTPPGTPGGSHGHDQAKVIFTVVIPGGLSTSARRASYISTNTQSMSLVVNGGSPQVFALTPSSNANCTSSSGAIVCSNLEASAPPGTDSFVFTLYQNAVPLPTTPTVLSIAAVNNQVITMGVANQLGTFTLNPVLGSMSFSITAPGSGWSAGTAASGSVNIIAKDPSGATIIAPGSYVTAANVAAPIGLSTNQSADWTFSVDSGAAAATGSLAAPSDTASILYNGTAVNATTVTAASGSISATQTISALHGTMAATLSSSASAANYHITTAPPELDFYETGITGTVGLSETGYSGNFTLQSDTCNTTDDASATGNYLTFSPGVGNSGTSFTASALAAGTSAHPAICTATFADTFGQTLSVTFSVTTISFGLQ